MPIVEARPLPLSSSGIVKMEERKRPAPHDHEDAGPPHKRQVTAINGGSKGHQDADMPGKDELEVSLAIFGFRTPFHTLRLCCHMEVAWLLQSANHVSVLQRFQKEAIWRQMQEYKREKVTLETRLSDQTKRAAYHDDHLRTIDAWFSQVSYTTSKVQLRITDLTGQFLSYWTKLRPLLLNMRTTLLLQSSHLLCCLPTAPHSTSISDPGRMQ